MSDLNLARGWESIQKATEGLSLTLLGKIDDAERKSEYYNGLQTLSRGLRAFDLSLEGDKDWRGYSEKSAKKEDELWAQVDQQVKHQGAKNDLEIAWMQMKDKHQEDIQNIANHVRNRSLYADLVKRIDTRSRDVEIGAMSAADATAQNEAELKSLSEGPDPAVDPVQAEQTLMSVTRDNQLSEVYRRASQEARVKGWDQAIIDVPGIASGYDHLIPDDIPQIQRRLLETSNILRAQANIEIKKANGKREAQIIGKLKDNDVSGALNVLNGFAPGTDKGFQDVEGGKTGAEYWEQWHGYLNSFASAQRAERRAEEVNNPVFNSLMLAVKLHSAPPDSIVSQSIGEVAKGNITWKMQGDIEKAAKGELAAITSEYLKPFDEMFKDQSLDPTHRNAAGVAEAMFRSYAAQGPRSETELKAKQEELLKDVKDAVANESMDKIFHVFSPTQPIPAKGTPGTERIYGEAKPAAGKMPAAVKQPTQQEAHEAFSNMVTQGQIGSLPKRPAGSAPSIAGFKYHGHVYVLIPTSNGWEWFSE